MKHPADNRLLTDTKLRTPSHYPKQPTTKHHLPNVFYDIQTAIQNSDKTNNDAENRPPWIETARQNTDETAHDSHP